MSDDLVISRDPKTGLLVASLPGVLEPWRIDSIDLADDVDVDAYRKQLAPIIAEFKTRGAPYALDAWPNVDDIDVR